MTNIHKIKHLAALILIITSFPVFSSVKKSQCLSKYNTICHKIIKLNPKMDHKKALKLSNVFYKASKKFRISPTLLVSIAYQESRFRVSTIRKVKGLVFDENTNNFKEIRIGADFCMMQIHFSNIKKMKLDTQRLLNEAKYCVETGAKILKIYKKRYAKTDKKWWTYYNAITKSKREIYFKHVTRHLSKIDKSYTTRDIASKR